MGFRDTKVPLLQRRSRRDRVGLRVWGLGFWSLGFRGLGFGGLGFCVWGF